MFSMQHAGGDCTDVGSSCSSLCLSCLTLFMAAVYFQNPQRFFEPFWIIWSRQYSVNNSHIDLSADIHTFFTANPHQTLKQQTLSSKFTSANFTENLIIIKYLKYLFQHYNLSKVFRCWHIYVDIDIFVDRPASTHNDVSVGLNF